MGIEPNKKLARWQKYKHENRDKINAYARERYAKHRDLLLARKILYDANNLDKVRESQRRSALKRSAEIKALIFQKYGNKCKWCGFEDIRALQIDHVFGGGSQDVKNFRSKWSYYRHVFEDESGKFQLLCANCNQIKRFESAEHRQKNTYSRNPPKPGEQSLVSEIG